MEGLIFGILRYSIENAVKSRTLMLVDSKVIRDWLK